MWNNFDFKMRVKGCKLRRKTSQLVACSLWLVACSHQRAADTKFQQYYVQGEQLYVKHCSNCHQKDGAGLGRVFPPINTSDYMEKNLEEVLCLMKYGKKQLVTVNGVDYNMEMKGIMSLTELEIAELATYIYNTWSHQKGIIEIPIVEAALKKCEVK